MRFATSIPAHRATASRISSPVTARLHVIPIGPTVSPRNGAEGGSALMVGAATVGFVFSTGFRFVGFCMSRPPTSENMLFSLVEFNLSVTVSPSQTHVKLFSNWASGGFTQHTWLQIFL